MADARLVNGQKKGWRKAIPLHFGYYWGSSSSWFRRCSLDILTISLMTFRKSSSPGAGTTMELRRPPTSPGDAEEAAAAFRSVRMEVFRST